MKTITSCDDVFETLTAGPFPSGSSADGPIQEHLRECLACRELAEALRPACNLLHEALSENEKRGLPVYHATTEEVFVERVRQGIGELQQLPATAPQLGRASWSWSNRWIGGVCVALLVVLLASGFIPGGQKSSAKTTGWEVLEAMPLSQRCFRSHDGELVAASALPNGERKYVCCTNCHNNTSHGNQRVSGSTLLASCVVCHP